MNLGAASACQSSHWSSVIRRTSSVLTLLGILGLAACSTADRAAALEWSAAERSELVGRPAPGFTLPNQDEEPVSLASLRGQWVVLYFYPRDDTPGCTCQATEFTHLLQSFHRLNAVVLGVSPDSPADHRFFIEKHHLRITLLSDPDHHVLEAFDAWAAPKFGSGGSGRPGSSGGSGGSGGHVARGTVLIDPTGRIAYHWPEVIPLGHADRVRRKLEELERKQQVGTKPS